MTVLEKLQDEAIAKSSGIAEFPVESLGDFCNTIDIIANEWRRKVAERQTRSENRAPFYCGELSPWFRGVSNKDYDCEPSLFRFHKKFIDFEKIESPKINETEAYFLQRFKTFSAPFLDKLPKNDIEWQFLMRHHSVPSRLLDWSKGSFIALYLATKKSLANLNDPSIQPLSDAAVWMLEPRLSLRINIGREDHNRFVREAQQTQQKEQTM